MKILSIHISNIASLVDALVDFERPPLSSDPIFLISGPTGAGKSTILNSICLALYNECPPTAESKAKDVDSDNLPLTSPAILIRKGASSAEIRLTFIGNDGRRYEVLWAQRRVKTRTKRNGRPPELKYALTRAITDVEASSTEPFTTDMAQRLTGLTYEQFTRTTLLAQGRFSQFLVAPGAEKAQMLEKITGTDIYSEIGAAIALSYKDISDRLKLEKAALGNIRLLTDNEIAERNELIAQRTEGVAKAQTLVAGIERVIAWIDTRDSLQKRIGDYVSRLHELEQQSTTDEFRLSRETVALFDSTADVRSLITSLASEERQAKTHERDLISLIEKRLPALTGALAALKSKIAADTALIAALRSAIEADTPYAQSFVNAGAILALASAAEEDRREILKKEEQISRKESEIAKCNKDMTEATTELQEAEKRLVTSRTEAEKLRNEKSRLDIRALNEALKRPADALDHIIAAERAMAALNTASDEINELKSSAQKLQATLDEARESLDGNTASRPELEKNYAITVKVCDALSSIEERMDEMRSAFSASDTCPLCGTHHVRFVGGDAVSASVAKARQERDNAKRLLQSCDERISEANSVIRATTPILTDTRNRLDSKSLALKAQMQQFRESFSDVCLSDAQALAAAKDKFQKEIDEATRALEQADELLKKEEEAGAALQKATDAFATARNTHKAAEDKLKEAQNAVGLLRSSVTLLHEKVSRAVSQANALLPAEFRTDADNMTAVSRRFDERAENYGKAQNQIDTLTAGVTELTTICESVAKQLRPVTGEYPDIKPAECGINDNIAADTFDFRSSVAARKAVVANTRLRIEELQSEISTWLLSNPGISSERLAGLNDNAHEIETLRNKIKIHDEEMLRARAEHAAIEQQLSEHLVARPALTDDAGRDTLDRKMQSLKAQIDADKEQIVKIRTELSSDERARAESLTRRREIEIMERDEAQWKRLNDLLGTGNPRFRNVAQSYVLRTLLAKANRYLASFSKRYTLTARPGTLTVSVIDSELPSSPRAASSLSGGETFIVSLALALALASISKEKINVDTLFIDEGFGSLDSESLSMIIDALDTLYTIGGRRIGIISHMDVLKERIPTQIRLRKLGGNTSALDVVTS